MNELITFTNSQVPPSRFHNPPGGYHFNKTFMVGKRLSLTNSAKQKLQTYITQSWSQTKNEKLKTKYLYRFLIVAEENKTLTNFTANERIEMKRKIHLTKTNLPLW